MKLFSSHKFARIISTIFVPPSFTIIIFTLFAFTLETEPQKIIVTILIAIVFGFIAPIALFLFLRKKGKLADQDASKKEERTIPFLIAIVFYLIGLLLMIKYQLNIISIAFWFCYISNTIITIIINKFWKISAHAMGAAGPFSAMVFTFGWIGILMLPIVILVGWTRIELKCHSISQVVAGVLLAFISVYLQMYLITKYF
ncbi:MAG TPA: phosphoesterase PA-phosphatase [Ignavibacteriales bacterium]|nr:phosphoesterase PA-phosphatase [Ignavibacteriales bacterium]